MEKKKQQKFSRDRVYICTPVLNASETIDTTINSVVSQEGNFFLHYHVQDGGSTDDTLHKLERWKSLLSQKNPVVRCSYLKFTFHSERDDGIYDAIKKSFDRMNVPLTGIVSYINADDILFQGAVSTVCKIFFDIKGSRWVIGRRYLINTNADHRYISTHDGEPYSTREIANGLCDGINMDFIQQEGIFWRHSLWKEAGGFNMKLKLSGDWDLWRRFAERCEPQMAPYILGAFRKRRGQLSENLEKYQEETATIISLQQRRDKAMEMVQEGSRFYKTLFFNVDNDRYGVKSVKIDGRTSCTRSKKLEKKLQVLSRNTVARWAGWFVRYRQQETVLKGKERELPLEPSNVCDFPPETSRSIDHVFPNRRNDMPERTTQKVTQDELDRMSCFHGIDFGNGLRTKGRIPQSQPQNFTLFSVFPMLESIDLRDKSVIDIGSASGLLAFILRFLGAKPVVATDVYDDRCFRRGQEILGYKNEIEYHPHIDISHIIQRFGESAFDLVAFCGVLYHLLSPLESLLICRQITRRNGLLLLETACDYSSQEPVLRFNMGELSNPMDEPTTYYLPTLPALFSMLRTSCFDPLVGYRLINSGGAHRVGVLARAVRPSEVRGKTALQKRHDDHVDKPDHLVFGDRFFKLEHGGDTPSTIRYTGPEGLDKKIDIRTYRPSVPFQPRT